MIDARASVMTFHPAPGEVVALAREVGPDSPDRGARDRRLQPDCRSEPDDTDPRIRSHPGAQSSCGIEQRQDGCDRTGCRWHARALVNANRDIEVSPGSLAVTIPGCHGFSPSDRGARDRIAVRSCERRRRSLGMDGHLRIVIGTSGDARPIGTTRP